ncbi:hypothetical protein [Pseudomonas syringae]|uniref:hypothetical protein n=1 Tax=Pseudomonas syringae TaxID=317 RepID=UPI000EFFAEA2|nr:hypothetical protein [Pseudomonas syringae]
MSQNSSREEVAKILGEPTGFDISDTASKLRRNLLLVSVVILILILGDIQAGPDLSVFGVKLIGLTPFKLMVGLATVLTYNLVHYLWYCYELYSEWAVRLTGTKLSFVTGGRMGSVSADYPNNPKQSTLYHWWLQQARTMPRYEELIEKVQTAILLFDGHVEELQRADGTSAGTVSASIQSMKATMEQVRHSLASTESVIASARIPESLSRFDNRFKLLLKSQNLRVLIIEVVVPIVLAVISIGFLFWFFLKN